MRRRAVADLTNAGWSGADIALALGITVNRVYQIRRQDEDKVYDLQEIRERL